MPRPFSRPMARSPRDSRQSAAQHAPRVPSSTGCHRATAGAPQAAVETLFTRYQVYGLLAVQYPERVRQRPLRRSGSRPATGRVARDLGVKAVLAYRSQDLVESNRGRRKGYPLSLTPMYVEREDHVPGLIRLLSVGLRILTLVESAVRQRLTTQWAGLAGRYAGHPPGTTARPTTERLLECFEGLTLTIIREGRHRRSHLTPRSRVHRRILTLLNYPVDISTRLCPDAHTPA